MGRKILCLASLVMGLPAVLLAALWFPAEVAAAVLVWDNDAGDNDWFHAANWDPDDDPDPFDELTVSAGSAQTASDVHTHSGGSITIDGPAASAAFGDLYVGHAGPGTLGVGNQGQVLADRIDVGAEGTVNAGPGFVRLVPPLVNNGTVNVHQGDQLNLSGEVSGEGGFGGSGTVAFDNRFSPGEPTAMVTFDSRARFFVGSTYVVDIAEWDQANVPDPWDPIPPTGPVNDRIHVSQAGALLDGRLELRATTSLAPQPLSDPHWWYGSQTRTIVSAEGGGTIEGTFRYVESQPASWRPDLIDPVTGTTIPGNWDQGHLGGGVFLTRTGPQLGGVEYTPQATRVHLFQAICGDTNGDRHLNGHDFQAMMAADLYDRTEDPGDGLHVWPPGWPQGDFGAQWPQPGDDDLVDNWDVKLIMRTGYPGFLTGEPYDDLPAGQSIEWSQRPGESTAAAAYLHLDASSGRLTLHAENAAAHVNGYVIQSADGIFTGQEADNLGWFVVDTDREISGNLGFQRDDAAELGNVVGPEWLLPPAEWDRYFQDLTFTYTLRDTPGIFNGSLVIESPPGALTSVAGGDFNDPTTWDDGAAVPDAERGAVVQNHAVLVSSDAAAFSLRIDDPDGRVVVAEGSRLTTTTHVAVAQGTLSSASTAPVGVGTYFTVEDAGEFACRLGETGTGLVAASGNAYLDGTLSLKAVGKLRGPSGDPPVEWWGDQTRTILTANQVLGTFSEVPPTRPRWDEFDWPFDGNWGQGHIGRGVFLVDNGPNSQGITYGAETIVVDLFQAAAGDTNGDRILEGRDIQAILAANSFMNPAGGPWDWQHGDFTGDTIVDGYDIQAFMATGLWPQPACYVSPCYYDPPPRQAAVDPGDPGDDVVELVLDRNTGELSLDTGQVTVNGYVIRSAADVFTGGPAENLGWFTEDGDRQLSGNLGFTLIGRHELGPVIGPEWLAAGSDWGRQLEFTYAVAGSSGVYVGRLVVPEPGTIVMFLGGVLVVAVGCCGRRRNQ